MAGFWDIVQTYGIFSGAAAVVLSVLLSGLLSLWIFSKQGKTDRNILTLQYLKEVMKEATAFDYWSTWEDWMTQKITDEVYSEHFDDIATHIIPYLNAMQVLYHAREAKVFKNTLLSVPNRVLLSNCERCLEVLKYIRKRNENPKAWEEVDELMKKMEARKNKLFRLFLR